MKFFITYFGENFTQKTIEYEADSLQDAVDYTSSGSFYIMPNTGIVYRNAEGEVLGEYVMKSCIVS